MGEGSIDPAAGAPSDSWYRIRPARLPADREAMLAGGRPLDDARGTAAVSRRSEPRHNPLACGALGDYDPRLVRSLAAGTLSEGLAEPTFRRGVLVVKLLHLWHERYRGRLAGEDPLGELVEAAPGVRPRGAAAKSSA